MIYLASLWELKIGSSKLYISSNWMKVDKVGIFWLGSRGEEERKRGRDLNGLEYHYVFLYNIGVY